MASLHVLRVFTDGDAHGNPLGVFLEGGEVPAERRQAVAADLGFSETVFVDDLERGEARIFTPAGELPFAGHPSVGTGWLAAREGAELSALHLPAGKVAVRREGESTWVRARPEWAPQMRFVRLDSATAVEALRPGELDGDAYCWAWRDEAAGLVRSRAFVPELGIAEDEATGSAAVRLCAALGRQLTIRQGRGSLLRVRPLGDGWVDLGGSCVHDELREYGV